MVQPSGTAALIVVDMQEDFCKPHGSLAIDGARELAPVINELLKQPGFALRIATQDFHPTGHISFASQHANATAGVSLYKVQNPENPAELNEIVLWPDHCVQETPGARLISELDQSRISCVIQKGWDRRLESLSGFGPPFRNPPVSMTQLHEVLQSKGIERLFVVGVAFDGCVKSTVLDAVNFGYETFIVREGVNAGARSEIIRNKTLEDLRESGVRVIGTDQVHGMLESAEKFDVQ